MTYVPGSILSFEVVWTGLTSRMKLILWDQRESSSEKGSREKSTRLSMPAHTPSVHPLYIP